MRRNDPPNPCYVDPNPYTGEADGEGVDYARLIRERAAKTQPARSFEETDDDVARALT